MTTPQNNNDKPEFKGFIISYNSENSYGFVRGEDGEDYYFKIRAFKENELPQISRQDCGKKIMPRMVIMNGAPYASHCPICGGKVRQFQKISFVPFVIIIGIIVLFFLSISFFRVFF